MLRAQPSQFLPLSNIKEYDVYYILEKNCGLLFHFIYEWIMKEGGPNGRVHLSICLLRRTRSYCSRIKIQR